MVWAYWVDSTDPTKAFQFPRGPGAYSEIPSAADGKYSYGEFSHVESCQTRPVVESAGGVLTLTNVDANELAGTFNLGFASGESLSGTFDALETCGAVVKFADNPDALFCP
jgi:hypothetical protein